MKIAFITDSIRKDSTGVGIYCRGLINAIIKFTPNLRYFFIDYKRTEYNKKRLMLVGDSLISKKKSVWYNYLTFFTRNLNFDYIFNCTGIPHFFPFRQKEVFIVHDLQSLLFPQFCSKKSMIYNKLFLKKTLVFSHKIIVNSEKTKNEIVNIFSLPKEKIFKIYFPSKDMFKTTSSERNHKIIRKITPYILSVGTLDMKKNVINLVKAFENLKQTKDIPHKLILVGKNGFKAKEILDYISKSKFKNEIILMGYVNEDFKFLLIKNSAVCTYLSFYEGLGIPVFEAAYFYKPIICSNKVPIANEIFKKNMFLVDPYRIEDIHDAISKALNNYPKVWLTSCKKISSNYFKENFVKKKIRELYCFINNSI